MFKKLTTTRLLIIFIVLGGIVLFNRFYKNKKEENTFRTEFVSIDSSAVTEIKIYPRVENGREIKISRNGQRWELQNEKVKAFADSSIVRAFLAEFSNMKSISLAGQDKSTWKELEVDDSTGTRIKITAGNKSYDMIAGKFAFNQATRSGLTNIRHASEEEVYAVPGFLAYSVNQPLTAWRNKTFISGNKDNWTSLTFSYPSDSSFVLGKTGEGWTVNGEPADSANAAGYLNQLASVQGNGFIDGYKPTSTPAYTITIDGSTQSQIIVKAYSSDSIQKLVLHSSINPDAYFSESQSRIAERIFKGKSYFLRGKK